jgi:CBS domain-containing protein
VRDTIVAALVFAGIIAILAVVKAKAGGRFSIETNWVLIAVLPIIFWLFLSGKIESIRAGGVEVKAVIRTVSAQVVERGRDYSLVEFDRISAEPKVGLERIDEYIKRKLPALSFQLGYRGYAGSAIREYLQRLSEHDFFKHIVFEDRGGKFVGMMPASSLLRFGRERNFEEVRQAIEEGRVGQFPDLIGRERAVTTSISKRQALETFEQTDADELPVVDEEGRLVGILSRSKLSSGVLAAILRKVEE